MSILPACALPMLLFIRFAPRPYSAIKTQLVLSDPPVLRPPAAASIPKNDPSAGLSQTSGRRHWREELFDLQNLGLNNAGDQRRMRKLKVDSSEA